MLSCENTAVKKQALAAVYLEWLHVKYLLSKFLIAISSYLDETIWKLHTLNVMNSCMNTPPSLHVPHFCWHRAYFPGTLGKLKSLIFSHYDVNNIFPLLTVESLFTRTQKTHVKV